MSASLESRIPSPQLSERCEMFEWSFSRNAEWIVALLLVLSVAAAAVS